MADGVIAFELDGVLVRVPDRGDSLLGALREDLGVTSVKDGCSPQGQCGCCTVWVDGAPRVSCVTPATRVAGRSVTTIAGLDDITRWTDAFVATGASQCGFCTPGIVMRLAALQPAQLTEPHSVRRALLAHLCRCTGWNTILEAAALVADRSDAWRHDGSGPAGLDRPAGGPLPRDLQAAARRATIEGGSAQRVGADVVCGDAGFAADTAPAGVPVAVRSSTGEWLLAPTVFDARRAAHTVQGRRTTAPVRWPVEVPHVDGAVRTLQTTWVEPAYLETDASWCAPGDPPASALANGGAFGGKRDGRVESIAADFAAQLDGPVRVQWSREDVVRYGPKRPPVAVAIAADGTGVLRLARPTSAVADDTAVDAAAVDERDSLRSAIAASAPGLRVEFVDVDGPVVGAAVRAAGWAEAAVALSSLTAGPDRVRAPDGAEAWAEIVDDGGEEVVRIGVRCGRPLDEIVLRSYCIGAAHMALGWVRSEAIAVGDDGAPEDLTIRSFGILRAVDTPQIVVVIEPDDGEPVNGSDAVFAALAAAAWRRAGHPPQWPTGLQSRR